MAVLIGLILFKCCKIQTRCAKMCRKKRDNKKDSPSDNKIDDSDSIKLNIPESE